MRLCELFATTAEPDPTLKPFVCQRSSPVNTNDLKGAKGWAHSRDTSSRLLIVHMLVECLLAHRRGLLDLERFSLDGGLYREVVGSLI